MKAYGYHRRAKLECKYGCCTMADGNKHADSRKANDRAAKKNGRRITPRMFTALLEN